MFETNRWQRRVPSRPPPDLRPGGQRPIAVPDLAPATRPHDPALQLSLARGPRDLAEAQHLRYLVFGQELGAQIGSQAQPYDTDEFDEVCDHLLVRETRSGRVVGTYRLLAPERRARIGRYYADSEFDLSALAHLQPSLVEVGRSCVHPEHRAGAVLLLLWTGLTQYMRKGGHEHLIGCASASLADGGPQAAALRDRLQNHLVAPALRVTPRVPFVHEHIARANDPILPPLIKGYLRVGARICGEPAWDPGFHCADFLVWLALSDMQARYARRLNLDVAAPAAQSSNA